MATERRDGYGQESEEKYPELDLVIGNIATGDAAKALAKLGADAIKVGVNR